MKLKCGVFDTKAGLAPLICAAIKARVSSNILSKRGAEAPDIARGRRRWLQKSKRGFTPRASGGRDAKV